MSKMSKVEYPIVYTELNPNPKPFVPVAKGELLNKIPTGPITEIFDFSSISSIYNTCYGNKQTCSEVNWKYILETKNIIEKNTYFDRKQLRKLDETVIDTITEEDWEKYKNTCMIIAEKDDKKLNNKKYCIAFFKYAEKCKRTDADIRQAVTSWLNDEEDAIANYGHISDWDVSKVTDMSGMFLQATSFNGDINTKEVTIYGVTYTAWNVSTVTNMRKMF
jgi:hypothetical protein